MISKKIKVWLFVLCLIIFLTSISFAASNDPCKEFDKNSILKHVSLPDFSILSKRDVGDGICEAILEVNGEDMLPVYITDNFVLVGDMFRFRGHVTKDKMVEVNKAVIRENKSALDEVTAFTYKPLQPKSIIYYITDPECPYCEKAKFFIKQFADDNHVEIKVVFYPLPMHPNAKDKSIKGICAGMTYQDYIEGNYNGDKCNKGEEKVAKSISVLEKLRINGTPTFIGNNGERVVGYDPDKLKEIIEEKS